MIPNAMAPIIVEASLALAGYIVAEAALSFLGFGIQDPIPTWGNMLSATQQFMLDKPWLPLVPGTADLHLLPCFQLRWRRLARRARSAPEEITNLLSGEPFMGETTKTPLLEVKNLKTYFYTEDGVVKAVDGVDFARLPR